MCSSTQGWGCSPIKGERELGLDRRETGWLLSNGSVSSLRGRWLQYERNELSVSLVDRLFDRALPGSYALLVIKAESILSLRYSLKIDCFGRE